MRRLLPALLLLALAPAASLCLAGPARAQMESREGIQLQNQILELRRDLQAMGGRSPAAPSPYYGGGGGGGGYGGGGGGGLEAQLLDRVQTLEDQVRQLRGQLDEQSNALRRMNDDLGKQIADLNFKLGNAPSGRGGGGILSTPRSPDILGGSPPSDAAPADAGPSAAPRRTPELALGEGNAALGRGDFGAAESAAREVLSAGRSSPRAGDASFLLAQALTGQRNFQAAAVAYDDAYNRSRTGSRAPDALLGLANALTGLNERPAACATLDKLRKEFPTARNAVRETAATLRARNGCA